MKPSHIPKVRKTNGFYISKLIMFKRKQFCVKIGLLILYALILA